MSDNRIDAFRFDRLRAASDEERYLLHIAALEWSLDAPITIQGVEDIQSRRSWVGKFEPYAHQVENLFTFCRHAPVGLLADDVGLGKTISAGLILAELMERRKVSRALVLCPKLLLPQWQEELGVKFGIPAAAVGGAEVGPAVRSEIPIVITTYHSARARLEEIRHADFDMLILDEAHKLRNLHGTNNPPQFATAIRQSLAERAFRYVLMLTATPIQNRLWDLYSLVDLMTAAKGHKNPLGSPTMFSARYIDDSKGVRIKSGRREEFREHLRRYIVRRKREETGLQFPHRNVRMQRVPAEAIDKKMLDIVKRLLEEESLNGLSQASLGQAVMSSPEAMVEQLKNMATRGTIPESYALKAAKAAASGGVSGKLKGLSALILELKAKRPADWRLVVFTCRVTTQDAIGQYLKSMDIPHAFIRGGKDNTKAVRDFRDRPENARVLVSTDAGAEGVNLQSANVLVNFDLPWNPMVLEQRIGRIQRLASRHAEVHILNLVLAGSVEERIVGLLSEKLQAVSESLGDIEAILDSAGSGWAEGDTFESMLRELVVASLRGANVEEGLRQAAASIDRGKNIFDQEKETVDQTLGNLDQLHSRGPRVPQIDPVSPSIPARDFVVRALKAEGARLEETDDPDLLILRMSGRHDERIVFSERAAREYEDHDGVFTKSRPRLYLPGKKDFERLAQTWARDHAALVRDASVVTDDAVARVAKDWAASLDGVEVLAVVVERSLPPRFRGTLVCRGSVAVDHDRLEKLVTLSLGDSNDPPVANEDAYPTVREFDTSNLSADLAESVAAAAHAESGLAEFCRFYEARRLDEEAASGKAGREIRSVAERYTPRIAAEAVAAKGVIYAVAECKVLFSLDGTGQYEAQLLIVPAAQGVAGVLDGPKLEKCDHTGRSAPEVCIGTCSVSNRRVIPSALAKSDLSGRLALIEYTTECAVSGKRLLLEETGVSVVSGRRVSSALLHASAISGHLALTDEFGRCEFTDAAALPNELFTSEISGKLYRSDERCASVVSGRRGHASEFVNSRFPEGLLAIDEAELSDVSDTWIGKKQSVLSEKPPYRVGATDEAKRCSVTGKILLLDEVGVSCVSGRTADLDMLQTSARSGRAALADEMILCAQSSIRLLPDETGVCALSKNRVDLRLLGISDLSGVPALLSRMLKCEFTGIITLPDGLLQSEISGKMYRKDQRTASTRSMRSGHSSEFVLSRHPPGILAIDEAEQSAVSGDWADKHILVASERPPYRRALESETVVCSATRRRLLRDEAATSEVSGRLVDRELLISCAASGKFALADEMVICHLSGRRFLPCESGRCEITGQAVDLRLLATSGVTGRLGLKSKMVTCAVTGILALPTETEVCAVTGTRVICKQIETCSVSNRLARRDVMRQSAGTGGWYIRDAVTERAIRSKLGSEHAVAFVRCAWWGDIALATDIGTCTICGLTFNRNLLNSRGEFIVLRQLLDGSPSNDIKPLSIDASSYLTGILKHSIEEGMSVSTPDGKRLLVAVRFNVGFLRLFTVVAALVLSKDPHWSIEAGPVRGKRRGGVWVADSA